MDCGGSAPLMWAGRSGGEEVMRIWLGLDGVSPDKSDKYCQIPLHIVARNGQEGVVKNQRGEPTSIPAN